MARQIRKKSGTGIYHVTLRNGRIDKLQFEEGYCQAERYVYDASQDEFTFCYYDRDHLGNIRQVTEADGTSTGNVIQTMNYYPFGAEFCDGTANSSVQPYKYNGKELDMMHGLNTYDYGARQYFSILGRWDRIDPLCEKYYNISPYAYCHNNPVFLIDVNGEFDFEGIKRDTNYKIAVVMSSNYSSDKALQDDYEAARKNNIPIILVQNIDDFADAMNSLNQMNVSINIYSLNSHGRAAGYKKPASFSIGEQGVDWNTDFSPLKDGLEDKTVFINACRVGVENSFSINYRNNNENLVEHIARQTSSTVYAPSHRIQSGYSFNGGKGLNGPTNGNIGDERPTEFIYSYKGSYSKTIYNLSISVFRGVQYDKDEWPRLF